MGGGSGGGTLTKMVRQSTTMAMIKSKSLREYKQRRFQEKIPELLVFWLC